MHPCHWLLCLPLHPSVEGTNTLISLEGRSWPVYSAFRLAFLFLFMAAGTATLTVTADMEASKMPRLGMVPAALLRRTKATHI